MKKSKPNWKQRRHYGATALLATILTSTALAARADSINGDNLLKLLQKKGLISEQEAGDLRDEAARSFTNNYRAITGMPDWVNSFKFNGDFRGRFEENNAQNQLYTERDRYRYRVRFGVTASMMDNFDVGLRLASGNPQVNPGGTLVGGQPITANTDLGSLESRKFIWVDAAYGRWTPIKNDVWTLSGTIGKMDNPFQLSNMIWDYDIDPEGAALQSTFHVNQENTLKLNGGFFVLDEINQAPTTVGLTGVNPTHDPYVFGSQLLWEAKWSPVFETSAGVAAFDIANRESLSSKLQPLYNSGNTRDANGFLKYNYDPIIGTASATYKFDGVPFYPGPFPVKISGEFMHNPGAPVNNEGYRVGLSLGKCGRKHAWEINYHYQCLEADAWFDALVDDDNGAFYSTGNPQLMGTGKASGWFGGTNVKGHLVQATYSFTDFLNLTFTYYHNDLIIGAPTGTSTAGHFMADLMWKF